jgi:hypothetical protein
LNTRKPEHLLQKYFDYFITDDIGEVKGKQRARCRICKKELARAYGSTASMRGHLKGPHEEFYKLYDDARQKNIEAYQMLNMKFAQYSLQNYFDYKRADKTAKCRICQEEIARIPESNDSLTDHLKGHEEFFKMYDSAKRKFELERQQKKRPRGDDDKVGNEEDEETEGEEEPMGTFVINEWRHK